MIQKQNHTLIRYDTELNRLSKMFYIQKYCDINGALIVGKSDTRLRTEKCHCNVFSFQIEVVVMYQGMSRWF